MKRPDTSFALLSFRGARVTRLGDVTIFKIFSPKNFAKKLAFLTQNKANFLKKIDHNFGF
jgi:hypothetical protein